MIGHPHSSDRRVLSGASPRESRLKRRFKTAFYWFCLYAGPVFLRNSWLRLRGRTRYTVLVYHRVNDTSRDVLTTSSARFAEHLGVLTRRYPVLSLRVAVAGSPHGRYLGPNAVVITFDDGYADNYELAAPILERFGAPATFFVTVGLMGTSRTFEHDRRSPHRFSNLTWDQIRSLVARGFEIGSHSMSHLNLAQCPLDEARHEIRKSRTILEEILARPVRSFAYPFGGPDDMTPAVLREIRNAGYDVITSAYGGVNDGRLNPMNVLRTGVDESFDALTLRAEVEAVSLQRIRHKFGRRSRRAAATGTAVTAVGGP
jgi:peptidoglycan/xylan/chitin deacetylase (PgdA/CDA1 family)